MKLYRVCTENKNHNEILNYLDKHFPDGYTIIHANGTWQGIQEKSLVIEIMGDENTVGERIDQFAYWLKKQNNQQAIMLQVITNMYCQIL